MQLNVNDKIENSEAATFSDIKQRKKAEPAIKPEVEYERIKPEDSISTHDKLEILKIAPRLAAQAGPRKYEIVYTNIFTFTYLHGAALYGLYLCFTSAKWETIIFAYLSYVAATIGVTVGAHRLWSHKSFKASKPLEIILMAFLSIANQRATHWIRDHRVHHKYSETDADPHNASRGFFYSHIGWLFVKKHPEVKIRGQQIDMSDIYNNSVLMFQHRHAKTFIPFFSFGLPTLIPIIFWSKTIQNAWYLVIMRYVFNFHIFFLVNSAAHMWGNKPYERNIQSTENEYVSLVTLGEGYHNYHHVFPWDYRSSEFGSSIFNYTKLFIDFVAKIGMAYDLKVVPSDMIKTRAVRTGDGSLYKSNAI